MKLFETEETATIDRSYLTLDIPRERKHRDVALLRASEIKPKKIKWLWPNRVPLGKLTLFVGDPDRGKSMVATYVVATTTTARRWVDAENVLRSSEVLVFASEDDYNDTAVPRLMAADADLKKVHFGEMRGQCRSETPQELEMRLDLDAETIKAALAEHRDIRLVIIDPVSNYLGDVKMTDEQAVRSVLKPLQKLAAEQSVAILGVMHLNKKADLLAINRVGGAMAFVGVARAVWLFCADEENPDQFQMLSLKKNIGKRSHGLLYRIGTKAIEIEREAILQPCIEWVGETNQSADAVLASKPVGRPRDERDQASQWLKELLRHGPVPSKEIEAQCGAVGFTYRTLERIKDEPDSGVEAFREGEKWNWKLTDWRDTPEINPSKVS